MSIWVKMGTEKVVFKGRDIVTAEEIEFVFWVPVV